MSVREVQWLKERGLELPVGPDNANKPNFPNGIEIDGTEFDASELQALENLTAAEVGYIDGSVAGTVVALKNVVVDANKDVASFRNVTATGEIVVPAIQAADGSASAGEDLSVEGGAGDGEGNAGGKVDIDGGAGVAGTSGTNGSAGGAVEVNSGAGGGCEEDTGGAGGAVSITGGAGGGSTTAAATGGAGGTITLTAGDGGADGEGGSGTGGAGGDIVLVPGSGGAGNTAGADGAVKCKEAVLGGRLYANTAASTTVTNVAAETAFSLTYDIPANTIAAGDKFVIEALFETDSVNGTDDHTYKLKIGGTTFATITKASPVADDYALARVTFSIYTIGATGTGSAYVEKTDLEASATLAWQALAIVDIASLDTTAAITVSATAEHAAQHADNQSTLRLLTVHRA